MRVTTSDAARRHLRDDTEVIGDRIMRAAMTAGRYLPAQAWSVSASMPPQSTRRVAATLWRGVDLMAEASDNLIGFRWSRATTTYA